MVEEDEELYEFIERIATDTLITNEKIKDSKCEVGICEASKRCPISLKANPNTDCYCVKNFLYCQHAYKINQWNYCICGCTCKKQKCNNNIDYDEGINSKPSLFSKRR